MIMYIRTFTHEICRMCRNNNKDLKSKGRSFKHKDLKGSETKQKILINNIQNFTCKTGRGGVKKNGFANLY